MTGSCGCLDRRFFLAGLVSLTACGPNPNSGPRPTTSAVRGGDGRNLCPDRPRLSIASDARIPPIDDTKTIADLIRLNAESRGPDAVVPRHGTRPVGLTRARLTVRSVVHVGGRFMSDTRRACLGVERVEVRVAVEDHEVLVARDGTRPGTCQRDVVLEHEDRHVAINVDFAADAKARIEAALQPQLAALPWMEGYGLTAEGVSAQYLDMIRPTVQTAFEAAASRARQRHADMDTDEAYRRDWARCASPRA